MIDPDDITCFDAPKGRLQEQLLFWIAAAGKNGWTTARCLNRFLAAGRPARGRTPLPFSVVRRFRSEAGLAAALKSHGFGCHTQRAASYLAVASARRLDLATCTIARLMEFPGIGPKTARGFVLYTRPGVRYAVLDRHILRGMRELGCAVRDDKIASLREYEEMERVALRLMDERGWSPVEFDRKLWLERRIGPASAAA